MCFAFMQNVWSQPAKTQAIFSRQSRGRGVIWFRQFPVPSWPLLFRPKLYILPFANATVWHLKLHTTYRRFLLHGDPQHSSNADKIKQGFPSNDWPKASPAKYRKEKRNYGKDDFTTNSQTAKFLRANLIKNQNQTFHKPLALHEFQVNL